MKTTVDVAIHFTKNIRKLARKYPKVSSEVEILVAQLENGQRPGNQIPNIESEVYKVRLSNPSAQKGKSGGFRVIYYLQVETRVVLLAIYAKSDRVDFSIVELRRIIKSLDS